MQENTSFHEKQYLGYSKYSNLRRIILALFFFIAYYFSKPELESTNLLFYLGTATLLLSGVLMYVLHLETTISNGSLIFDGLWTARKVKVEISSIVSVEQIIYSNIYVRRAVYNLHRKGRIHFYTRGKDAVLLTDKDGLEYVVGTQRPEELFELIKKELEK
jgi:predicted DNA-binding transcriptional regulator